jgi:hypothetical protein
MEDHPKAHPCLAILGLALCSFAAADSTIGSESVPDLSGIKPQAQLLETSRLANRALYASLKSFVCREEIERFQGNLRGSKMSLIDHVSANLSFENGVERYSDIRQNTRGLATISALTGAWSEGEFGTLLEQTAQLLETQTASFIASTVLEGETASIYRFSVTEEESPWVLEIGPQQYRIPFTTDVWILDSSGEILKISRKSISMPKETRISEIDWDVTLNAVDLNGKTWRLPTAAAYSVCYAESKRREWNKMTFSRYRRYSSESSLRFEGFD